MGACASTEEVHSPKGPSAVTNPQGACKPAPCAEEQNVVLVTSTSLAAAAAAQGLTDILRESSPSLSQHRPGSIKRNQVAPEPSTVGRSDSSAPKDQHLPSLTNVITSVETKWGLTNWESRECSPRAWPSFIQDLQQWSHQAASDRTQVLGKAVKMQALMRQATAWLDMAGATHPHPVAPYSEISAMLAACAAAACHLAECVLQPIVSRAERLLTHGTACSSSEMPSSLGGSGAGTARWDTLEVDELLEALQAASLAEYDMELERAAEPARAAVEMLQLLQGHSADARLQALPASCVVPSMNSIVSMVGIIFFHRVVLEGEDGLLAKVEQLARLMSGLGWPRGDSRLLAACLTPHAKAMLAGLHQAAQGGGEMRANFQVRRRGGAAFWEALQQAGQAGLLRPPEASASTLPPRCYKVFPSFVDEWANEGAAARRLSSPRRVQVEAGEGHGPRKEFFCLAASSMTGQPSVEDANAPPTAAELSSLARPSSQQQQQRPLLFTFNRSAGAFWYNTSLESSTELLDAFRFAGWLIGQSLLNKAPLGVPLAPALLSQLLLPEGLGAYRPTLGDLEAFDPEAAASVRLVGSLPGDQLAAMMAFEGLPVSTTAEQYTTHAVRSLLVDAVEWQARALASGFQLSVEAKVLRAWCVDAKALAAVLDDGGGAGGAGGRDVDVRQVFRVVMDQELSKDGGILGEALWSVVGSWPQERRLQFLVFVTGSSRLPLPGSELLKVEAPFVALGAAEHRAQLGMLPQAHTCDNLLELPNYWAALLQVKGYKKVSQVPKEQLAELKLECRRILEDRLTIAVTCFLGYGLDERSSSRDE